MKINERYILLQGAAGNRKALIQIWEIWSPKLMVFLKGTGSREDMEDLNQEIMLKIYRSLDSYNPLYAASTWIYSIASSCRIDWLRRNARTVRETIASGDDIQYLIEGIPGAYEAPDILYIRKESGEEVHNFILNQNNRDRQILFLYCYEDLSGRAIARSLNLPYETVRYRIKLLKQKLKEVLEQ